MLQRRYLALTTLCVVISLAGRAFAFRPTLTSRRRACTTQTLLLSTKPDNPDDDAISKLIGKRSKIKRKSKEELPSEDKNIEPTVDLDLDKLPEFKTERPAFRRKKEKEEDEQEDDKKKPANDAPIVDFKADYDDENDFHIPNRMGMSTTAWGDPKRNFVASGKLTKRMIKTGKFVPGDLQLAYNKMLEGGVTFVETAPTYGAASRGQKLSAEDILNRCFEEQPEDLPEVIVMEGLGASAWTKPRGLVQSLSDSCDRLGTASVELFQLPKSFLFPSSLLANALVNAMDYCNYVGTQGITNARTLRRFCNKLDDKSISLTSNAFDFSLTKPGNEDMIDVCKSLNVIPLITDPLDGGLASGVYTATNPSGGQAGGTAKFTFKELEKLQPLHSVQETVAERVRTRVLREMRDIQERYKSRYGPPPKINTDITTTQVALNYIIAKGGVPLPEVNSPKQAEEVLGCLGWDLSEEDVDMLDAAVVLCKL